MTSLSDVLPPAALLVFAFNAAFASLAVCATAVVLSRVLSRSLPARHALLVVAIAVCLVAPLVMPLLHVPAVWTIQIAETGEESSAPAASKPADAKPPAAGREQAPPSPATPILRLEPNAADGADAEQSAIVPPVVAPSAAESRSESPPAAASDAIAPAQASGQADRFIAAARLPKWGQILGTLLCGVWCLGVAGGLVKAVLSIVRLYRWMQTVSLAESPVLLAAAKWAADSAGLPRPIPVHRSGLAPAPASFGLFHPRIVVPNGIESSLSADQLRAVLKHEMAHLARRDLWIGLLQQAAQIIYWWNPLVRLANRQLADLREQICDEIAIRGLDNPGDYAATLLDIAERCSRSAPIPGTIGFGASPATQLERRIRRIIASPRARCVRLNRWTAAGVSAAAVLMTATILAAQVQITPPSAAPRDDSPQEAQAESPTVKPKAVDEQKPTLHELIQRMAAYERAYLPFEMKVMETYRFSEDLTIQERARFIDADGRKHQRLMEYAQLAKRVWRTKETHLLEDEIEQGPYQRFSDGGRIVQGSPEKPAGGGKQTIHPEYVETNKNRIFTYVLARPIYGVFCLSAYGAAELFSEAFKDHEGQVELAWDKGDAKLTFVYMQQRFVLWLSRAHDWHPVRLQRYWNAEDKLFHDEWEVTKFVRRGEQWRVAEGTFRYRDSGDLAHPPEKVTYAVDLQVLEDKYGMDVDEAQFQFQIPDDIETRDAKTPGDRTSEAEQPPAEETRPFAVRVIDLDGRPIPGAAVRFRHGSDFHELERATTDERGIARTSHRPQRGAIFVDTSADGFRPAEWGSESADVLPVVMTPRTTGVAVDEQARPIPDAWITSEPFDFRADGILMLPDRAVRLDPSGKPRPGYHDWSAAEGRFELKTELTLRSRKAMVKLVALDPKLARMAIRFVSAPELAREQKLVLEPVHRVHGQCLLEGVQQIVDVWPRLATPDGNVIAGVIPKKVLTPDGLRLDFELRLPPGDYVLTGGVFTRDASFAIPFTIRADQDELDLGTTTAAPAGVVALIGNPAPKLEVQWRPGQEADWDKLSGNVVVLDFWGTWCAPCVAKMPALMEIADQFRDRDVAWISVHTPNLKTFDDLDREITRCQADAWKDRKPPFTTVIDLPLPDSTYSGQTSRRYGVSQWPTLMVVDRDGAVAGPVQAKRLAEMIQRLLDEQDAR